MVINVNVVPGNFKFKKWSLVEMSRPIRIQQVSWHIDAAFLSERKEQSQILILNLLRLAQMTALK